MTYCFNCGYENDPNAHECSYCYWELVFATHSDTDYEDNDPNWESARLSAEARLEQIEDELDDDTYASELRRLTQVEYDRLVKEQADELAHVETLSPEQQEEYWKWDGQKPPSDDDLLNSVPY